MLKTAQGNTPLAVPRKIQLYRKAQSFGRNASFIANVILTGHSKPTTKLAGLVALLEAGHEVSPAPYDIDRVWIDGQGNYFYSALENGLGALTERVFPNDDNPVVRPGTGPEPLYRRGGVL